ncbi:MAG TPA: hypothetical protein VK728_05875 [Candidatus Sulfotelmatobacter sp.]|jgi:hypothetical protein|nr:hypothetical protein [Candidatus Sulfotelmatobacter sp.]
MTRPWLRLNAITLSSLLLLAPSSSAFDTPLSDTAVREAYFLGQRHDEVFATFLQKYVTSLPKPKSGPNISSVSFFTPYAQTAIYSSQQVNIYSAQQAQLDHQRQPELVRVVIQIWFTDSYGEYIVHPIDSRSGSPNGFERRPYDFWRQFRVRVFQNDRFLVPMNAHGEPNVWCGDEGCDLTGATLTFEYPADAFTENSATVHIDPPEGDPVVVEFDLTSFR